MVGWFGVGIVRNLRGVLAALLATWFYLPFAVLVGVVGAVMLGVAGFFGGSVVTRSQVPALIGDLPLLGSALDALLGRSGGVVGGFVGLLTGLVLGFLGALLLFWHWRFADDPVTGVGSLLGVIGFGLLVGLVYTVYRVLFESLLLRMSGARRMSRRERELILPIVQECTYRLGLPNHPPVLINDSGEATATAHTRHLVIHRGLLATFDYDREVIAGVVAHGLVHWRNGDAIAAAFVRGVALPLYLIHAAAGWIAGRAGHPLVTVLVWVLLWPVLLTVRWVILPLQAADTRRAEFRADQGAVLAGHRAGLRRVLDRLPRSFEAGQNGWLAAVSAAHPANELRLERLEDPARWYPLSDPAGAGLPRLAPPGGGQSA